MPPRTWDELVDAARDADAPPVRRRGALGLRGAHLVVVLGRDGRARPAGRLVEPGGRVSLGGEAGEKAIRFWQRLVHDEQVMRPPPGRDYQAWQSSNESFLQGRIAMMWSSTAYVRYLEDNARFPVARGAAAARTCARACRPAARCSSSCARRPTRRSRPPGTSSAGCASAEQTIAWSTRTGYMPVTRPAVERLVERGWYQHHPNDRVAYDQLAAVDPWPWAPELFRIERDVVEPRLEEAVLTGARRARASWTRRATKRTRPA